jgi:hypothetical protein
MEIETGRASELESAVRQGAGLYPRCCADQKEEKEWKQIRTQSSKWIGKEAGGKAYMTLFR